MIRVIYKLMKYRSGNIADVCTPRRNSVNRTRFHHTCGDQITHIKIHSIRHQADEDLVEVEVIYTKHLTQERSTLRLIVVTTILEILEAATA